MFLEKNSSKGEMFVPQGMFLRCVSRTQTKGMTLLEVLITLGILGVSLGIILKGFSTKLSRIAGADNVIKNTWVASDRLNQVLLNDAAIASVDEEDEGDRQDSEETGPSTKLDSEGSEVEVLRESLAVDSRIQSVTVMVKSLNQRPLSLRAYRVQLKTGEER